MQNSTVNITTSKKIVMISPLSVVRFANIRPVSMTTKRVIKQSMLSSGGFSPIHPVLGYFLRVDGTEQVSVGQDSRAHGDGGDDISATDVVGADDPITNRPVFIIDGAHRIMAMCELIQDEHFPKDTLVPMVELGEVHTNDNAIISVAMHSNEMNALIKDNTFVDYLIMVLRIRENYVKGLLIQKPHEHVRLTMLHWGAVMRQVLPEIPETTRSNANTVLKRKQMSVIFGISKTLCPYFEHTGNPDMRGWQAFCILANCPYAFKLEDIRNTDFDIPSVTEVPASRQFANMRDFLASFRVAQRDMFRSSWLKQASQFHITIVYMVLARFTFTVEQAKSITRANRSHRRKPARGASPSSSRAARIGNRRGNTNSDQAQAGGLTVPTLPNDDNDTHVDTSSFAVSLVKDDARMTAFAELVMHIISAWDALAQHFAFKDVEHMVAPYMYFDLDLFEYAAVPGDMFTPQTWFTSLLYPNGMSDACEWRDDRAKRSKSVDDALRAATKRFIVEIHSKAHCMILSEFKLAHGSRHTSQYRSYELRTEDHIRYGVVPVMLSNEVDHLLSVLTPQVTTSFAVPEESSTSTSGTSSTDSESESDDSPEPPTPPLNQPSPPSPPQHHPLEWSLDGQNAQHVPAPPPSISPPPLSPLQPILEQAQLSLSPTRTPTPRQALASSTAMQHGEDLSDGMQVQPADRDAIYHDDDDDNDRTNESALSSDSTVRNNTSILGKRSRDEISHSPSQALSQQQKSAEEDERASGKRIMPADHLDRQGRTLHTRSHTNAILVGQAANQPNVRPSSRIAAVQQTTDNDEPRTGASTIVNMSNTPHFDRVFEENCTLLLCPFEELCTCYEEKFGASLKETVQLILTDPPHITRSTQTAQNSANYSLTGEQMRLVVSNASALLRPGGHLVIFSTSDQSAAWIRLLESDSSFITDHMPIYCIDEPHSMSEDPLRLQTKHANMVQELVHATKRGGVDAANRAVAYELYGHVPSTYPAHSNVITGVPQLENGERVMRDTRIALRNEQKPIALLKELIQRYSTAGSLVVDLFSGTFSTAISCVTLLKTRRFVGCEIDQECFVISRNVVRSHFATAVVNGAYPRYGDSALEQARSVLDQLRQNIISRRSIRAVRAQTRIDTGTAAIASATSNTLSERIPRSGPGVASARFILGKQARSVSRPDQGWPLFCRLPRRI